VVEHLPGKYETLSSTHKKGIFQYLLLHKLHLWLDTLSPPTEVNLGARCLAVFWKLQITLSGVTSLWGFAIPLCPGGIFYVCSLCSRLVSEWTQVFYMRSQEQVHTQTVPDPALHCATPEISRSAVPPTASPFSSALDCLGTKKRRTQTLLFISPDWCPYN
jgi:hypothetical protein